jgi:hypothetical protein
LESLEKVELRGWRHTQEHEQWHSVETFVLSLPPVAFHSIVYGICKTILKENILSDENFEISL